MKILFMTPGTIKSSFSYRSVAFGQELVKRGHEVFIIAPKFDKYSQYKDAMLTELKGIKILRPLQPINLPFDLSIMLYMLTSILLISKLKPDLVQIYKPTPITITGLLLKLFFKTKVVFDTDDIDSEVMKIEGASKIKIELIKLSEAIVTKYTDAIVTGSEYLRKYYSKKFKNKPIVHIPNGAEFENINTLRIHKNYNRRIVFLGNINRINILEPLFSSLKKLYSQKIKFNAIIIGNGTFLNYFKELSKENKIENQIQFLGHIPQNKLDKYIQVGDIGYSYMPNELTQKACSNMKVFQYMQFGAVPIVSDIGDLPLYTFFGKAGYIAKNSNIESLTMNLKDALSDTKTRIAKIKYGLDHAKATYKWSVLTDKLEKLYGGLL